MQFVVDEVKIMNERIKELAEQAGYLPDSFGVGHWDMPECKKFAELIVGECMAMCKTSVGNADYNTGRLHCLENIKEHFGIGMSVEDKKQLIKDLLGVSNDTKS
jgi:hypothetical protein